MYFYIFLNIILFQIKLAQMKNIQILIILDFEWEQGHYFVLFLFIYTFHKILIICFSMCLFFKTVYNYNKFKI